MTSLHRYPEGQNFAEIVLSHTVLEIQAFLCFAILAKNSKIQNCCQFLARQIFFENWVSYSAEVPCGSKIVSKSLYLAWFQNTSIFEKNSEIQSGRHFWRVKYLLKLGKTSLHRYRGQKFCRNRYLTWF